MSESPKSRNAKSLLKRALIVLCILGVGFFAGRLEERISNGYHFKVREEKKYDSALGEIRWRYVIESFGVPFLDPGTTMIEFDHRILYKAKRYFQEGVPVARNIETSGSTIRWNDGEYRFDLTLEKMGEKPEAPVVE